MLWGGRWEGGSCLGMHVIIKDFKIKKKIEMNMIEHSQVEQYKGEIEERARQDLVEKLKEVNLFCRLICSSVMCLNSPHRKLHFGSIQLMGFLYFP